MVGREIVESETVSSVSFPLYFDFVCCKNLFDDPAITELPVTTAMAIVNWCIAEIIQLTSLLNFNNNE